MLSPMQFETLVRNIRETLEAGQIIAILGWYGKFNDNFTSGLLSCKKVIFFDKLPDHLGDKTGLVLFTRCVDHPTIKKFKHRVPTYPHPISLRDFKTILQKCEDLLIRSCEHAVHGPPCVEAAESLSHETLMQSILLANDAVLDIVTRQRPRRAEMNQEDQTMLPFVAAFTAEASGNNGRVGIKKLTAILEQYLAVRAPQQLLKDGWFIRGKKLGSAKTSWYEAGPKMLALIESTPPDDPCEYAEWLIARKPSALKKRDGIQARLDAALAEINARAQAERDAVEVALNAELVPVCAELAEINKVEDAFSQFKASLPKK